MSAPTSAASRIRRRPLLMAIGGVLAGLGLALLLVHFGRVALGTNAPYVVVALGGTFGIALAYTLPPRARRSPRRDR